MASGPKGGESWCHDDTQKALAYRRLLAAVEQSLNWIGARSLALNEAPPLESGIESGIVCLKQWQLEDSINFVAH